jgi:hypothetical protein
MGSSYLQMHLSLTVYLNQTLSKSLPQAQKSRNLKRACLPRSGKEMQKARSNKKKKLRLFSLKVVKIQATLQLKNKNLKIKNRRRLKRSNLHPPKKAAAALPQVQVLAPQAHPPRVHPVPQALKVQKTKKHLKY